MINEATRAKKLGYYVPNIEDRKTGLPVRAPRGNPNLTSPYDEIEAGYKSVFARIEPRLKPIFDEIKNGNSDEIKNTLFISFTALQKLGINPRTKYNTPNGIYNYQLNERNYKDLVNNSLPFAATSPYIQFFKIKPQFMDNIAVAGIGFQATIPKNSNSLSQCYSNFIKKYPEITKEKFVKYMIGHSATKYHLKIGRAHV